MIDSCLLVSQSNHLKHSNKRCDWLKINVLFESIKHADDIFDSFCKRKESENKGEFREENDGFFVIKPIKKP